MWTYNYSDELYHHGILGQKWGVRRFQNKDGSLTSAGRTRYGVAKENYKNAKKEYNKSFNSAYNYSSRHPIGQYVNKKVKEESNRRWGDTHDKLQTLNQSKEEYKKAKSEERKMTPEQKKEAVKKAAIIGATVAGTALAAYGAYKLNGVIKEAAYNKTMVQGRKALDLFEAKHHLDATEAKILKSRAVLQGTDEYRRLDKALAEYNITRDELRRDISSTASINSKNIAESINTLRGHGGKSSVELENMDIETFYGGKSSIKELKEAIDEAYSAMRRKQS